MTSGLRLAPASAPTAALSTIARPRIARPLVAHAPYLDCVRHGLLVVDSRGRVTVSTAPARRLLAHLGRDVGPGSAIRPLLHRLCNEHGWSRRALFRQLRSSTGETGRVAFELILDDRTLEIEVQAGPAAGWVVTLEDVSARRAAEASAAVMARLDPLTDLPNRLLLRERLDEALGRLRRSGEACAVLLVDLDRFKPINDTLV